MRCKTSHCAQAQLEVFTHLPAAIAGRKTGHTGIPGGKRSCKRIHVVGGGKHGNEVANAAASVFTHVPSQAFSPVHAHSRFHRVIQVPGFATPNSWVKLTTSPNSASDSGTPSFSRRRRKFHRRSPGYRIGSAHGRVGSVLRRCRRPSRRRAYRSAPIAFSRSMAIMV